VTIELSAARGNRVWPKVWRVRAWDDAGQPVYGASLFWRCSFAEALEYVIERVRLLSPALGGAAIPSEACSTTT
jgi:hypothetical protein